MTIVQKNKLPKPAVKKTHLVKTLYGDVYIREPILYQLIMSRAVQRLKHIHQYGISYYVHKQQEFYRYDHSIGVLFLLQKFGTSLNEQIAGLLHDVSHTVFSHVGDMVFAHTSDATSYQDDIHRWYLEQTDIPVILSEYGVCIDDILHKNGSFKTLEQNIPEICADRLEYNLHGGYIEGIFSLNDIHHILNNLRCEQGMWFFVSQKCAQQLALCSLYLTEHHFGAAWNAVTYRWAAQALWRALELNIVTTHDIHFATDDYVWNILCASEDEMIKRLMQKLLHHKEYFSVANEGEVYDQHIHTKFRGINPWVTSNGSCKRLTEIDEQFAQEYNRVQNLIAHGWYIRFN